MIQLFYRRFDEEGQYLCDDMREFRNREEVVAWINDMWKLGERMEIVEYVERVRKEIAE